MKRAYKTPSIPYMETCIHLKACRRMQKIAKAKGFTFGRGCDENCTAYIDGRVGAFLEWDYETDVIPSTIGEIVNAYQIRG